MKKKLLQFDGAGNFLPVSYRSLTKHPLQASVFNCFFPTLSSLWQVLFKFHFPVPVPQSGLWRSRLHGTYTQMWHIQQHGCWRKTRVPTNVCTYFIFFSFVCFLYIRQHRLFETIICSYFMTVYIVKLVNLKLEDAQNFVSISSEICLVTDRVKCHTH